MFEIAADDTYFEQLMMITIEELKPSNEVDNYCNLEISLSLSLSNYNSSLISIIASEYWIAILLPVVIILLVIYPFVFIVVFGCFPKA